MSSPECESPARAGDAAGLGNVDRRAADDGSNLNDPPASVPRQCDRVRRAKLALIRDAVHEACGFCQLYGSVSQQLAEAGDDIGLLHALGRLRQATLLACQAGRDIRELHTGGRSR